MSVGVIQGRLESYRCNSTLEEDRAIREITQEIVLAALARTDFFRKAAFQGGTCLRILHGLNRFSEDLDFALMTPDRSFRLEPYVPDIRREMAAYGYDIEFIDRSKAEQPVQKAFLKDDSIGDLLQLNYRPRTGPMRAIRIKVEVDINPPVGADVESRYLDFPFPQAIAAFDPRSLFAGKLHAILCRGYLKGRDWYDFVWYTARKTSVNFKLLEAAIDQNGPWKGQGVTVDRTWCLEQLVRKIDSIDWDAAKEDIRPFVKSHEQPSIDLWSREFFMHQSGTVPE
jgi:predicted nucleotidyltransferase component of viral defense system